MKRRGFLKALGWFTAAPIAAKALPAFDTSLPPTPKVDTKTLGNSVRPSYFQNRVTSAPVPAYAGDLYFDTSSCEMQMYDGKAWVRLAAPTNVSDCATKAYVDNQVDATLSTKCSYWHSRLPRGYTRCPSCGAPV